MNLHEIANNLHKQATEICENMPPHSMDPGSPYNAALREHKRLVRECIRLRTLAAGATVATADWYR